MKIATRALQRFRNRRQDVKDSIQMNRALNRVNSLMQKLNMVKWSDMCS